jgi:hypothetical protein
MSRIWAIATLSLLLAGCADGQGAFVNETAGHFTPGVTTRAEAIAQLGPPSTVYQQANGSRTVSWARTGGLFAESDTRSLTIVFGPDDKLSQVLPTSPQAKP